MFNTYKKIYSLLDARERRRGAIVLAMLIIVAFVETLGVASIMPFVSVLSNPEVVETNPYIAAIYEFFNFESRRSFLFFLGLVFFAVLISSLALKALGIWAQLRFSHNRNSAWGTRLIGGYLRQPYEWFLNMHTSNLATSVLSEVQQVVTGSLFPGMQIIANVLVAIFLLALLIAVDPMLSVVMAGLLGGGYILIERTLRRRLKQIGQERRQANLRRYHIAQEAFGGIKDVKIAGLEESFAGQYRGPAQMLATRQIAAGVIGQLPAFAMQALLFGGMLLALLYLMAVHGSFQGAVPTVALYAFGGYRLMPALQHIYQNVSKIRFSQPALDALCDDFATLQLTPSHDRQKRISVGHSRLHLTGDLELQKVTYAYPGAERRAVSNLSLNIPAFKQVGFVGATGSGKTTTVDLILGLLRPQEGSIRVDGKELTDDLLRSWQRSLGYVPQHIFLSDDTVAGNIAFGIPEKKINMEAVEKAAKVANLHEFVMEELSEGYNTFVGERGIRLSGGQRQRIGIARALYHDPDVLILDEATSALDNLTEQAVMQAVHNLGSRKTVIIIAHRLSTVRSCDCIYLLEHGELVASGSYEDLIENSRRFRDMAEVV
ncbi:ABC-type multidrug transport system fused ATPase/permease subunit [Desulfosalsimonas propionicica]|uniref:ABC-type multidrug transport system fused ATPase/permease subunit n=1 Tax=Desulfosalsimonas propionicica TaxID=332175 RepID=A0A7W0HM78_9BACT|nr:ABC transporter ATP-binding protein [Desulfosalsimonas propionicica]MBA2883007.1 ABC-type multidrug transport system fused ATPase/permease subunit [Desulfosalsimonas propionicica]